MVTQLSKLAELIEKGSVPGWVVRELEAHKEQLAQGHPVTLNGPNGEVVTITPEVEKADPVAA
jgi:hypothetical protein